MLPSSSVPRTISDGDELTQEAINYAPGTAVQDTGNFNNDMNHLTAQRLNNFPSNNLVQENILKCIKVRDELNQIIDSFDLTNHANNTFHFNDMSQEQMIDKSELQQQIKESNFQNAASNVSLMDSTFLSKRMSPLMSPSIDQKNMIENQMNFNLNFAKLNIQKKQKKPNLFGTNDRYSLKGSNSEIELTPTIGKKTEISSLVAMNLEQNKKDLVNQKLELKIRQKFEKHVGKLMKLKMKELKNKKSKKKKCECCGGVMQQDVSPRTKAKIRKLQMIARRKASNQEEEEGFVSKKVKELDCPPIVSTILGICFKMGKNQKSYEGLSYKKLKKFIDANHPVDPYLGEKFNVYENITIKQHFFKLFDTCGFIKLIDKCSKVKRRCYNMLFKRRKRKLEKPISMRDMPDSDSDISEEGPFRGLTDAAMYIGEGPILYLQIIKTFAVLFLVLTIINLPIFWIFSSSIEKSTLESIISRDWEALTVGSLGHKELNCFNSHITLQKAREYYPNLKDPTLNKDKMSHEHESKMQFGCKNKQGFMMQLQNFGFVYKLDLDSQDYSEGSIICKRVNGQFDHSIIEQKREANRNNLELQNSLQNSKLLPPSSKNNIDIDSCNYLSMFKSQEDREAFYLMFKQTCIFKNTCTFDIEQMKVNMTESQYFKQGDKEVQIFKLSEMISEKCYQRIFNDEFISNEFIGIVGCMKDNIVIETLGLTLHKHKIGLIIVVADAFSVLFMYFIFWKMKPLVQEYLSIVDSNMIKYSDFSFQIKDIQLDETLQDPRMIKMKIWTHLNELLRHVKTDNGERLQIVDIQLSYSKKQKDLLIYRLADCRKRLKELNDGMSSGQFSHYQKYQAKKEIDKINEKMQRFYEKYEEAIALELKNGQNPSLIPKKLLQTKLEYVYITLKRNAEVKQVIDLFVKEPELSRVMRKLCCITDEIKDNAEFADQQLIIDQTIEPDQINWMNMEITQKERRNRYFVQILILIFVILGSILITVLLEGAVQQFAPTECQLDKEYNPMDAYLRQKQYMLHQYQIMRGMKQYDKLRDQELMLRVKQDVIQHKMLADYMQCYCAQLTNQMAFFWKVFGLSFREYDIKNEDTTNYCSLWYTSNFVSTIIKTSSDVVVIVLNALIAIIFGYVSEFLKLRYMTEQQLSEFNQIVFMEFFNMGLIVLITSFDPSSVINQIRGAQNNKTYWGFEPSWYRDQGVPICSTIFLSSVATNIPEVSQYIFVELTRMVDRNFKPNLKKDLEDEVDDEPNTKMKLQDQLNELYLGPEWDGPAAISRMISTLLVICSYSSGMPALYLIGALFFILTYLVNKLVLFKLYRKTLKLDRLLPLQITQMFNAAIFLHLIFGCFMLTNHILYETNEKPTDEVFIMPEISIDLKAQFEDMLNINPSQNTEKVNQTKFIQNALYERDTNISHSFWEDVVIFVLGSINHFHQQIYISFSLVLVIIILAGKVIRQTLMIILKLFLNCLKFLGVMITQWVMNCWKGVKNVLRQCLKGSCFDKLKLINTKRLSDSRRDEAGKRYPVYPEEMLAQVQQAQENIKKDRGKIQILSSDTQSEQFNSQDQVKIMAVEIKEQINQIYHTYDINDSKTLCMSEAFNLVNDTLGNLGSKQQVSREEFLYYFKMFDDNHDAELDIKEITQFLIYLRNPSKFTKEQIEEICREIDFEGGSNISKEKSILESNQYNLNEGIDGSQTFGLKKPLMIVSPTSSNYVNTQTGLMTSKTPTAAQLALISPTTIQPVTQEQSKIRNDNTDTNELKQGTQSDQIFNKNFQANLINKTSILNNKENIRISQRKISDQIVKEKRSSVLSKYSYSEMDNNSNWQRSLSASADDKRFEDRMKSVLSLVANSQSLPFEVTDEQLKMQEKKMMKYKNLFERPCYSENIYMELNITNLQKYYQKAQSELHDIRRLFKIRDMEDEIKAMTPQINSKIIKPELRVHFEELCYMSKLTNVEVKKYFSFLRTRIQDIEETIDTHFEMIKKAIRQDKIDKLERQMKKAQAEKVKEEQERKKLMNKQALNDQVPQETSRSASKTYRSVSNKSAFSGMRKSNISNKVQAQLEDKYQEKVMKETLDADPDLKFDDPNIYTYEKKLDQLYEFEDALLKEDRIQKENRRGLQTICRMQGSNSQSYFLYDAQILKTGRSVYYELVDDGTSYDTLGLIRQQKQLKRDDSIQSPRFGEVEGGQDTMNFTITSQENKCQTFDIKDINEEDSIRGIVEYNGN